MKRNIIFRIAFCIMGIACMIAGIRLIIAGPVTYIEQHEQVDWPEIRAEIVDISSRVESTGTRKHHSSTTYYDLIIEYEVNGNIYTNESRSHTKIRQVGDGITIKYDPVAPENFTTTLTPSISEIIILMVFGAVFTIAGFFVSGAFALIRKWCRRGLPEEKEELPPEEYVGPETVAQTRKFSVRHILLRILVPIVFMAALMLSIKFFPGTKAVDPEQFKNAAESKGFVTVDTTEKLRQDWRVGSMLKESVSVDNGTLRIDFCVMDTVPSAQQLYGGMSLPISDGKIIDNGGTVHELYSVETESVYVAKIRITTTIIYVWTPVEQKADVVDLLDSIGYWKAD